MRAIEHLQVSLWELLEAASTAPDEADLRQLLDVLEEALLNLDTAGQLQVGAAAVAQIVQVFEKRSILAFEELAATSSEEGPVMPTDAFERYVRRTMEVDFEQFIEPLERLPRKERERQTLWDEQGSIVGKLDQTALLQALDEQMTQNPGLTEVEAFNQAMRIAHNEDVSARVEAMSSG